LVERGRTLAATDGEILKVLSNFGEVAANPLGALLSTPLRPFRAFRRGQTALQVLQGSAQRRLFDEADPARANKERPGGFTLGDRGNLTGARFRISIGIYCVRGYLSL
jgi:hypothetical protein